MSDKPTIEIIVSGRPMSGKSILLAAMAGQLMEWGFDVDIEWGLDGTPKVSKDDQKLKEALQHVRKKTKIKLIEKQAPRVKKEDDK